MKSKMLRNSILAGAVLLGLAAPNTAQALDIFPGDYTVFPSGVNLALGYFEFTANHGLKLDLNGGYTPGRSKYNAVVGIVRGLHYFDINGVPMAVQAFMPFYSINDARIGGRDTTSKGGLGDLTVGLTVFPLHGADQPGGTTLGITAYVQAPTGSYNVNANINPNKGTWNFMPQVGLIQNLGHGFFVDLAADVSFWVDHDETLWGGPSVKVSQDPSVQLQAYLRYQFSPATMVAFGYSGTFGGEISQGARYTGVKTSSQGLRAFASHMITPTVQIAAEVGTDVSDADGGFKQDFMGVLRLTKVF